MAFPQGRLACKNGACATRQGTACAGTPLAIWILVGLQPNDAMGGNDGPSVKVIAGEKVIIAYLQNPDSRAPETANVSESAAASRLHLPPGAWRIRWFDPRTGQWHANPARHEISGGYTRDFKSPFPGDAVLLLNCR